MKLPEEDVNRVLGHSLKQTFLGPGPLLWHRVHLPHTMLGTSHMELWYFCNNYINSQKFRTV